MNPTAVLEEFSAILCVCPCCGGVFRLSDARPYAKGKRPATIFDELDKKDEALDRAEQRLTEKEEELREEARERGRTQAKRRLKQIDPVFSGTGIDPQDVKIIFHPVQYVVFEGLNGNRLRQVLLMGSPPVSKAQERIQVSLRATIRKGNVEFSTLRIGDDGSVEGK